jgi:hypothetical protein
MPCLRSLLGAEPVLDEPYYVQFSADGQRIGLDPHGHDQGMSGPVVYWHVDDIRRSLAALLDSGATQQQDVRDVGGGELIATVTDRRQRDRPAPGVLTRRRGQTRRDPVHHRLDGTKHLVRDSR